MLDEVQKKQYLDLRKILGEKKTLDLLYSLANNQPISADLKNIQSSFIDDILLYHYWLNLILVNLNKIYLKYRYSPYKIDNILKLSSFGQINFVKSMKLLIQQEYRDEIDYDYKLIKTKSQLWKSPELEWGEKILRKWLDYYKMHRELFHTKNLIGDKELVRLKKLVFKGNKMIEKFSKLPKHPFFQPRMNKNKILYDDAIFTLDQINKNHSYKFDLLKGGQFLVNIIDKDLMYQTWVSITFADHLTKAMEKMNWEVNGKIIEHTNLGLGMLKLNSKFSNRLIFEKQGNTIELIFNYHISNEKIGEFGLKAWPIKRIPDILLKFENVNKQKKFIIFDPKNADRDGEPKRSDLDKMQTYFHSIRDLNDKQIIDEIYIIYPGTKFIVEKNNIIKLGAIPSSKNLFTNYMLELIKEKMSLWLDLNVKIG